MPYCPNCGNEIEEGQLYCNNCGERLDQEIRYLSSDQAGIISTALGFLGLAITGVGVFMPIIDAPILGSINYFQNGKGDGTLLLGLVLVGVLLLALRQLYAFLATTIISLLVLLYSLGNFLIRKQEVAASIAKSLEGNPFAGLGKAAIDAIQIQWGAGVMSVGVIMSMAAAIWLLRIRPR
jgi:predicted nucleic acid-binding Zn ribbon protein